MKFDPKVCAWPGCDKEADYRIGSDGDWLGLCESHNRTATDAVHLPVWIALWTLRGEEIREKPGIPCLPEGEKVQASQAIHLAICRYYILRDGDSPSRCTLLVANNGKYEVDLIHAAKCEQSP